MSRKARQEPAAAPPRRDETPSEPVVRDARGLQRAGGREHPRGGCQSVRDPLGDFSEQIGANFG